MAIKYLAERLDLIKLLCLKHPEGETEWSAIDICDAWAQKRSFLTAKTGRPDTYRAANSILRMALDGKLTLCLYPPGYVSQKHEFEIHPELSEVKRIQAITSTSNVKSWKSDFVSESDDNDDENGKRCH